MNFSIKFGDLEKIKKQVRMPRKFIQLAKLFFIIANNYSRRDGKIAHSLAALQKCGIILLRQASLIQSS
jgi:hypothetical protein